MGRMRVIGAVLVVVGAALTSGCGAGAPPSAGVTVGPVRPMPPRASEITSAPNQRGDESCDATASSRPSALPPRGAMPAGTPMARIVASGRVKVGVAQDGYLFGFRNPRTGTLEGFDIDIAKEIARDLFGDPSKIDLVPLSSAERVPALRNGRVDLVVNTFSATCARDKEIDFSAVYYVSEQKVLTIGSSGIESAADLGGKRACSVTGTTSLEPLFALPKPPTVIGMQNWTDCLVALQQGAADAISTDAPILHGLALQDNNLEVVGPPMAFDSYAIGIADGQPELVRFVNASLDRMRADGTWQSLYQRHLSLLGPSPGPPAPKYKN
ncbi:transporter substrate-binding domain-containing protein [Nocardia sp. NPDC127579]|uniref:glutamate ABC transporter substrate-binding protein n=1 Tax=Nocardia sp. NPDC127579 TaxID=3345402 RepID=UPI003625C33D